MGSLQAQPVQDIGLVSKGLLQKDKTSWSCKKEICLQLGYYCVPPLHSNQGTTLVALLLNDKNGGLYLTQLSLPAQSAEDIASVSN